MRAVKNDSGELSAKGKIVHSRRRPAVAEAKVIDAKGRLCATAGTTSPVFDLPAA